MRPFVQKTPQQKIQELGLIQPEETFVSPSNMLQPTGRSLVNVDLSPDMPGTVAETVTDNFPTLPEDSPSPVPTPRLSAIEQEIEDSENFADGLDLSLPDEPAPETPDEYAQAAAEGRKNTSLLAMLQASSDIGKAIAGGGKYTSKSDANLDYLKPVATSSLDELTKRDKAQADRAAKDALADKARLSAIFSDPDSEASAQARESYATLFEDTLKNPIQAAKIREGRLSLNQLEGIHGALNAGNIAAIKEAAEGRKAAAAVAREAKDSDRQTKLDIKNLDWADTTAKNFYKNEYVKNYDKISQNTRIFDNAINNQSGTADIAALYSYVKFLDSESAVREGEIDLLLKGVGGIKKLELALGKALARKDKDVSVIPKDMIEAMRKVNKIYQNKLASNVDAELERIKLQANKRGADIYTAIPDYDNFSSTISQGKKAYEDYKKEQASGQKPLTSLERGKAELLKRQAAKKGGQ